ncbi:unnamed protein product [Periconia digitata]|uniref:AB hydrolase-1 domain-containing protein n=1 Tax=Periconia digitata TaxID=1303443 RepID=A0A9W4UBL0_9PLEO|nr:unnamed protein product [Periconia digitata]
MPQPFELVLPRPNTSTPSTPKPPIRAPTESSFTAVFGKLLPPAQYIHLPHGAAAYYSFPPRSPSAPSEQPSSIPAHPSRVLLLHGVQTPALGLLPLTRTLQSAFPSTHFVLLELWGHGLSDTPQAPHVPSLFHGLVDALLAQLDWHAAHLIGYSFGGALTASYAATRPEKVLSFTLVAPAGLIQSATTFSADEMVHLRGGGDEVAAGKWVVGWLEGEGGLVVPEGWEDRVASGEVVPEALREWQMREHQGHAASVVGIFRDGEVMDGDEVFGKAARTQIPSLVVLGELDSVCSEEQLRSLEFADVFVVKGAGHGVIRDKEVEVEQVKGYIERFWKGIV